MNSLFIAIVTLVLFLLGYRFYGKRIAKLWGMDPSNKTPALKHYDGVDYVPAKHWLILFGHHFASIAGAGPILGPVIACMVWGWLPAAIWIVVGSIFLGAVHDFSSLMASLRLKGKSMADVAESVMSYQAKLIFGAFIWLSLILVVAVFAAVAGKTLATTPQVVIPTFGLIFVAIFVGVLIYKLKINLVVASAIGVILLFVLIVSGYYFPITMSSPKVRTLILLGYAFCASIIPVNILLPTERLSFNLRALFWTGLRFHRDIHYTSSNAYPSIHLLSWE